MLSGLMSRCTMPARCAVASASARFGQHAPDIGDREPADTLEMPS